jgi:cytochrome c oxidase subunit 2
VQKFWSILFGAVMLGSFLLFVIAPFAGWWLPKNVASFGGGIDALFYVILVVTAIFFVLTEAILVYNLFRFVGRPGQKSSYVKTNHRLELVWTLVPGVLLFILAVVQIDVWAEVKFQKNMPKEDGMTQQMEVTAKQWEWRVRYPSSKTMEAWEKNPSLAKDYDRKPDVEDLHLPNEIHVWNRAKVLVHLKTRDVLHSFFLPNLRLKQDALPGKTIPVWFEVKDKEYNTKKISEDRWVDGYNPETDKLDDTSQIWELACAEFCGTRHSMMRGKLFVHKDKADFLDWLRHVEKEQSRHLPPQGPVAAR